MLVVVHGRVKVFFGARSHNQGRYGFIRLFDEFGRETGEEAFFHLNDARMLYVDQPNSGHGDVRWHDERATVAELGYEPRRGDLVTCVVPEIWQGSLGLHPKVTMWTFTSIWRDAQEIADHDDYGICRRCGGPKEECDGETCPKIF